MYVDIHVYFYVHIHITYMHAYIQMYECMLGYVYVGRLTWANLLSEHKHILQK